MPDYQKMYLELFNAITDALEELNRLNIGAATERLLRAQTDTEDLYIDTPEE